LLFDGVFGFDPGALRFPRSAFGGAVLFAAPAAAPAVLAAGEGAADPADELDVGTPGVSDFTYATSAFSCSSLTCPWNEGMIGWKPETTFAVGIRIDSRT